MPKEHDSKSHDKPCTICNTPRQVLVRCQIDESGTWHFVCPGKCWKDVSGGVEDAKGFESQYPFYRYGGMWKNKHSDGPINAKKPRKVKERQKRSALDREEEDLDPAVSIPRQKDTEASLSTDEAVLSDTAEDKMMVSGLE